MTVPADAGLRQPLKEAHVRLVCVMPSGDSVSQEGKSRTLPHAAARSSPTSPTFALAHWKQAGKNEEVGRALRWVSEKHAGS
jgi:hypothetical protein